MFIKDGSILQSFMWFIEDSVLCILPPSALHHHHPLHLPQHLNLRLHHPQRCRSSRRHPTDRYLLPASAICLAMCCSEACRRTVKRMRETTATGHVATDTSSQPCSRFLLSKCKPVMEGLTDFPGRLRVFCRVETFVQVSRSHNLLGTNVLV